MPNTDVVTDGKQKALATGVGCGGLLLAFLLVLTIAISCTDTSPSRPTAATTTPSPPPAAPPAPTPQQAAPLAAGAGEGFPFDGVRKTCSDFATQAQAQAALLPGDPHGLDQDGDGLACEVYFGHEDDDRRHRSEREVQRPQKNSDSATASSRRGRDDRSSADTHAPAAPKAKKPHVPSGHPCRPGERDGDKDGYCGEGR